MREWVIYALIMVGVLFFLVRDNMAGALAGVLISGPLYLALGAVLAKFGYRRKSLKDLRAEREAQQAERNDGNSAAADDGPRTRPPPTSRTQTGPNRPKSRKRR